jgi:hypothetical protein
MFEQRIALYFWLRDQPNPGERASIDVLARFAFRKEGNICKVTAFGGRKRHQFNERARAHEDLPAEGVGGEQKTVGVKAKRDLIRGSEVGNPRLQVVRIGGEDRVRKDEATNLQFGLGSSPGGHSRVWNSEDWAARQQTHTCGACRDDYPATDQLDEFATFHRRLSLRGRIIQRSDIVSGIKS